MDLRFASPSLRRLDEAGTEVLVAGVFDDERPPHGLAGLVDYRLSGRVSALLERGFFTAAAGEVVLVPGKPKLPFDKLVLFGLGPRAGFQERAYRAAIDHVLMTLEGLRARTALVELPGRHVNALGAERAVELLIEAVDGRLEHDAWTLVDDADAQRVIAQLVARERRRLRRV
jgi:hypothetical protein